MMDLCLMRMKKDVLSRKKNILFINAQWARMGVVAAKMNFDHFQAILTVSKDSNHPEMKLNTFYSP